MADKLKSDDSQTEDSEAHNNQQSLTLKGKAERWAQLLRPIRDSDIKYQQITSPQEANKGSKPKLKTDIRGPFLQDVDKITFCNYFRKLQAKTQVHPLAESSYIRTRLTHSLEVSTIARSLGMLVGKKIIDKLKGQIDTTGAAGETYTIKPEDFGAILQAAGLAHDIGNPPFGHKGEDVIKEGFGQIIKETTKAYSKQVDFIADMVSKKCNVLKKFKFVKEGIEYSSIISVKCAPSSHSNDDKELELLEKTSWNPDLAKLWVIAEIVWHMPVDINYRRKTILSILGNISSIVSISGDPVNYHKALDACKRLIIAASANKEDERFDPALLLAIDIYHRLDNKVKSHNTRRSGKHNFSLLQRYYISKLWLTKPYVSFKLLGLMESKIESRIKDELKYISGNIPDPSTTESCKPSRNCYEELEKLIEKCRFFPHETEDFTEFDGNTQGFHILTTSTIDGKDLNLTYPVLATFCKYPNLTVNKAYACAKKRGIFGPNRYLLNSIHKELEIREKTPSNLDDNSNSSSYGQSTQDICKPRHPLTYLLEVADDTAYLTADLCDAYEMGLRSFDEVFAAFGETIQALNNEEMKKIFTYFYGSDYEQPESQNSHEGYSKSLKVLKKLKELTQQALRSNETPLNKKLQDIFQEIQTFLHRKPQNQHSPPFEQHREQVGNLHITSSNFQIPAEMHNYLRTTLPILRTTWHHINRWALWCWNKYSISPLFPGSTEESVRTQKDLCRNLLDICTLSRSQERALLEKTASNLINLVIHWCAYQFLQNEDQFLTEDITLKPILEDLPGSLSKTIGKLRQLNQKVYTIERKIALELQGCMALTKVIEHFGKVATDLCLQGLHTTFDEYFKDRPLYSELPQPQTGYRCINELINKKYFNSQLQPGFVYFYDNLALIRDFIVSCTDTQILEIHKELEGIA